MLRLFNWKFALGTLSVLCIAFFGSRVILQKPIEAENATAVTQPKVASDQQPSIAPPLSETNNNEGKNENPIASQSESQAVENVLENDANNDVGNSVTIVNSQNNSNANSENLPQPGEASVSQTNSQTQAQQPSTTEPNDAVTSQVSNEEDNNQSSGPEPIETEDKPFTSYDLENTAGIDWGGSINVDGTVVNRVVKQGEASVATEASPTFSDYTFPSVRRTTSDNTTEDQVATNAGENTNTVDETQPTSSTDENNESEGENSTDTNEDDLSIPDEPIPDRNSRRLIVEGTGPYIENGSLVRLNYDMFSWSTGELVESSKMIADPFLYQFGSTTNEYELPVYLIQSLLGRTAGSRVQVIFGQGLPDLPEYFNRNDAYVLMVDINL